MPDSSKTTAREANAGLAENPALLIAGGVAVGMLIGMLLPRLERERTAFAPLGRRLAEGTAAAAKAAKAAGREQIDSLIPGADAAKARVSAMFGNVIDAAKEAGTKR